MSPAASPPAKLLLSGPAGCGKTHAALAAIRAAATTPGPRGRGAAEPGEALLVLPTYAQVMHVKRLALSRWDVRGLLDQPFTTFTAAGERFLPAFRVHTLPSAEERDRLMEEALRQRDEAIFREIADRPGFRAHLLRLVKEIKQTGLEGGEARESFLRAQDEVSPASLPKLRAFLAVFEAYEDLLERAGLEDHEDTLRRLAQRLEEQAPGELPGLLVVDGFDDFSRVEERILAALVEHVVDAGGRALVTLPWDEQRPHVFGGSRGSRQRLLAAGFVERTLRGFPRSAEAPLAALAAHLFTRRAEPVDGGSGVHAHVAGDAEDEAEAVVRAVRAVLEREQLDGVRGWRDIGIVVRRLDDHAPRIESACARLGVPVRVVGRGDDLGSEPLVRALRGPLDVLAGKTGAGRFEAVHVLEWLRRRALCVGDLDPAAVDAWDVEMREHGFPSDFHTLADAAPEALKAALSELAEQASALQGAAGTAQLYDVLMQAAEALSPLPEPSGFDDMGRPLDTHHDRRLARDVHARQRVCDIVRGLKSAVERTGVGGATAAADAVLELREAIERTTLSVPDRRLDAVTLMDAEEARFWDLPVVVVAGLEEGSFPLRPREDVLLRDKDRDALRTRDPQLRLPLAREREIRERRLFYGAVTRASRRLILVRRAYDDGGDPRERSSYVRELERVVAPTVVSLARAPGRLAHEAAVCFTRTDWLLHAAARLGVWSARRSDISATERTFAAALQAVSETTGRSRAARQRRTGSDALWSTEAGRVAVLAAFEASVDRVSVSRLNHALVCPQRFFLAYVAGVPQDDLTLEGPVFDFRTMGKALHKAFELALAHPQRTAADVAQAGVRSVHASGIEGRLLEVELTRSVELLRDRERRTAGPLEAWPEGFELAFGYDESIELGPPEARFRIGGYVDRIDRAELSDGSRVASIIDYKRSRSSVDRSYKSAKDGTDLQIPLYARALERLLDVRVVGFEWMAGINRDRRILHDADATTLFERRREAHPLLAEDHAAFRARIDDAVATAAEVVGRVRAGVAERAPHKTGTCRGKQKSDRACPWYAVCRPDVAALEARLHDGESA